MSEGFLLAELDSIPDVVEYLFNNAPRGPFLGIYAYRGV